ncbi:hypothetical protein C2857_002818 [Epichloe festucae Fl1]|uniref:Uncharacterized protein n=1 Tax=Epichloe festucae (strain Fl1) TaxID=877507 RepID=A0A7S9KUL9_EPIFF|nr:hypothetical protein C2857_002818 [Epichloe festucae Fl1]
MFPTNKQQVPALVSPNQPALIRHYSRPKEVLFDRAVSPTMLAGPGRAHRQQQTGYDSVCPYSVMTLGAEDRQTCHSCFVEASFGRNKVTSYGTCYTPIAAVVEQFMEKHSHKRSGL